jgi:AGZA family xanthine/uracil permease-like MFS transporter
MGVIANFPLATAPGMGLNAYVAYTLAAKAGSWQAAMGIIFLDGIIMLILVTAGLREAIMNAIPRDLRLATGAGIGLFIAFLGLVNAKIVMINIPDAPLKAGTFASADARVARVGGHRGTDGMENPRSDFDRHRGRHHRRISLSPFAMAFALAGAQFPKCVSR